MKAPADKTPEPQRQATAHARPQKQNRSGAEIQFIDNRVETESLRQLQAAADNSPRTQELAQLKSMMNNSPRSVEMRNLQAMIHNSPRQVAQRQLHNGVQGAPMELQTELGDAANNEPVQRVEDEELLQGKFTAESPVHPVQLAQPSDDKPNNTGLPDQLKAGVESLSGLSLDHVKVHYNSSKPVQLNAHAYAQGTDIHVAPGQEQHLPHEAWHVVHQAQGRVKPTLQLKDGVGVNDDAGLEAEADLMGGRVVAGVVQAKMERNALFESDSNGFAQRKINNSLMSTDVVQRTEWKMVNQEWVPLTEVVSEPPLFSAEDGTIYNDGISPPTRIMYGEADFSFSNSYANKHPDFRESTTATSYEKKGDVEEKYPKTKENTESLIKKGVNVQHGVDATSDKGSQDVIHFNFPHTGNRNKSQGTLTSEMLGNFFQNSQDNQEIGGIVRMGMVSKKSYKGTYGLHNSVHKNGYKLVKKKQWKAEGYKHKQTKNNKSATTAEGNSREIWFQKTSSGSIDEDFIDIEQVETESETDSDEEREMFFDKRIEEVKESGDYRYNSRSHDLKAMMSEISELVELDDETKKHVFNALKLNTTMANFLFDIQDIETNLFILIQNNLPSIWSDNKR